MLDPSCNPAPTRRQQGVMVVAGGDRAPSGEALIQVDIDTTVVLAHSGKEQAAPTWNKTLGSIRWPRSPTMAPGRGQRWPSCCARATRGPTPRRAHRSRPAGPGPAAPPGADPHRLRRRHPCLPGLARRAPAALLGGHGHHRGYDHRHPRPPDRTMWGFPVGVSGRYVRDLRICAPQAMVQQSLTESLATAQGKVVPSTLIG